MSRVSLQNSLKTQNITSPFTFIGEYVNITEFAEVNVLLQGTLALDGDYYIVSAYLSNDRLNVLEIIETNIPYPISNKLIKITPSANFIKIKLETFALEPIQNFNMSTVLKSVLPLSSITTINGSVAVSNFPVTQPVSIATAVAVTGTFYPPTQPVSIDDTVAVSGTFYPPTQPVSIIDTVAVSGTFYPPTQPVSIIDTVAVSGTFYPPTQPISGSVLISNTFIHTREEPTSLAFHNNSGSNIGVVLFNGARVLRSLSISNTSTSVVYVHIYNIGTIPTDLDNETWLIPIAPNVVSNIMNQTDHYFDVGISYRVTTAYNNNISPTLNVCFLNGAIAY